MNHGFVKGENKACKWEWGEVMWSDGAHGKPVLRWHWYCVALNYYNNICEKACKGKNTINVIIINITLLLVIRICCMSTERYAKTFMNVINM